MLTEQERTELLEFVELYNKEHEGSSKIVYIDETKWKNAITRRMGTVKDLFFYGSYESSRKPLCLLSIRYNNKEYKIHEYISHVNMSGEVTNDCLMLGNQVIGIDVQDFCNPVRQHQICTVDGIEKILKGQLMGQNANSRYQVVHCVLNDIQDMALKTNYGEFLKANSPIAQLLTRRSVASIRTTKDIQDIKLPAEDEVAVKFLIDENYTIIKKEQLEENKANISTYYPVITYEQTKDLFKDLPKQEIDMTVIGLGSAGTGVLDQVSRSTFIKSYFIIDFDKVERKNLRNQWYNKNDIGYYKTSESSEKLYYITDHYPLIHCGKFQEASLEYYKSKYVVSGFDNLECRMELLERCLTDFESKYLIDLRYLDHSSSIYFIDLEDEKQVKYYRNLLQADIDGFEEATKYITTKEELVEWFDNKNFFIENCKKAFDDYFGCPRKCWEYHKCTCKSEECKDYIFKCYQESGNRIKLEEESSCVRENFIDIYKYSSSFVFAAIREIESGNDKPFTHIEAQTEVIPTSVVIRR